MNVLGLHAYSHDSGAALVCDGELFAIAQERLTRVKYDGSWPAESIEYVFSIAGLSGFEQVDLVVVDALGGSGNRIGETLSESGYKGPVAVISHHDAHAASAFYTGPFLDSAILVVDACGSFVSEMPCVKGLSPGSEFSRELQSYYRAENGKMSLVSRAISQPGCSVGPGAMYGLGALMCGFSELEGGKLMALAALGEKDDLFPDCVFFENGDHYFAKGDPEHDPLMAGHIEEYSRLYFRDVAPRKKDEPILQLHCEIAKAVQDRTRDAVVGMAGRLHEITGSPNLCVAGGFGLNCATNSEIKKRTPFENVYIQPAATDTGVPLGAALYGYYVIGGNEYEQKRFSPFLGRDYSENEIVAAIAGTDGIVSKKSGMIETEAAELLASGKIGGWFRSRSEYGPRALGARSILADPGNMDIKDRLNTRIKRRENFRPYAPVVLRERVSEFFDFDEDSPYMLLFAEARARAQENAPAVLHVDRTARIQTVEENDGSFYKVVKEFEKITGVPILLNTSFNRRGEPLVESPADAAGCFIGTDLDFLVMGDYLVVKKGA
ncbi:MAG TPA: carbamoyltransferase C-terminal domain-containing protein [bacterium]|nr:carbamoyltransferase C-terminal domain-containing protein [bacterium]